MARHGAQAVVWQTAINPVIALELLAAGAWQGAGVLGPEAFDPVPFLDRLRDRGEAWHLEERAALGTRRRPGPGRENADREGMTALDTPSVTRSG